MKIKRLYLENFKSYKEETINFEEGINCILGKNGAGKSSIIEAIGYTMFNYLYLKNKKKYIRYGETKAKIELDYEANDGVIYTIIRTISSSDKVKLINHNTQEVIEDVGNVYPYISKTLGIKQDRSLANLFEEIIAVPQGEFVSLFLMTDSDRKRKFEDLFNLKIYEDLFTKALSVVSKNKDNITALEKENERHKGETVDFEDIKEEAQNLSKKIDENKKKNAKDIDERNSLDILIKKDQKTKSRIDEIEKENAELDKQIAKLSEELKSYKSDKDSIEKAESIIKENKAKYDRYIELDDKLKIEEKKAKQYVDDNTKITELKGQVKTKEAGQTSASNLIIQQDNNIGGINLDLEKLYTEIDDVNKKKKAADKEAKEIKDKIQNSNKNIEDLTNKNESLKNYLVEYKLEYKEVENYEIIDIDFETETSKKLAIELGEKQNLEKELADNNNAIIHKRVAIENIEKNMDELSKGNCPILNKKCLTLSTEGNPDLLILLAKENEELERLNNQKNSFNNQLKEYDDLDAKVLQNKKNIEHANEYINVTKLIKENIKNTFIDYDVNDEKISKCFENIESLINRFKEEITNENNAKNELLKDQEKSNELFSSIMNKLVGLQTKVSEKNNAITQAKSIQNSQKDIIKKLEDEKAEIQKEINNLVISLEENRMANTQVEVYKNEQESLKNSYELYLQNIPAFNRRESNNNSIKTCEDSLDKVTKDLGKNNDELKSLRETFDDKTFEDNKSKFNALDATILANENMLKEANANLIKINEKIEYKQGLIDRIKEIEKQIKKYKNIEDYLNNARIILKNLPIELSRRYRDNISSMATIYYHKISKENVTIEIDETYKVNVIDNSKKSNIKDMTQLSGGEQMSLAISIRISMLKYFAGIDMYFLDEPTVNLDKDRRFEIADVIKDYSNELKQLFVISHDDTFESITTNILKLEKNNNESELSIE